MKPTVNESKIRFIAGLVFSLTLVWICYQCWFIPALLLADFFMRTGRFGKYSLFGNISDKAIKKLEIKGQPIYYAPKIFAAKIGLVMALLMLVFTIAGLTKIALVFGIILALFSFLEAAFGFCAGCVIYSYLVRYF